MYLHNLGILLSESIQSSSIEDEFKYTSNHLVIDFLDLNHQLIQNIKMQSIEIIQLRIWNKFNIDKIENTVKYLLQIKIIQFEIILPYFENCTVLIDDLFSLIHSNNCTPIIKIVNSPKRFSAHDGMVTYYTESVNIKSCGKIGLNLFVPNFKFYELSKRSNSCLSGKFFIDFEGNIKNCPSMSQSFGNIKDTTLQKALDHPDFKKYWNIKKDDITKCKDCEFRYICTDCRAYLEDPEDKYSAPLKCGYDPYTGKWDEWSKNPLKKKTIEFYGMEDVLKDNNNG